MALDCIILDFDGTFTDVEKEAVPFLEAYRDDLGMLVGDHVTAEWDVVFAHIGEQPERYGWEFEGRIVAPAHADPYIMATATAQKLLDDHGLYPDANDRRSLLEGIFRENYPKAANVFRPDAREVVEALLDTDIPVFVVTNSQTEAVETKLDALAPRGRERLHVFGNAKKYVIAAPAVDGVAFRAIPETVSLPGLERPIYLKRGPYYELLTTIASDVGAEASATLVCGDIYELDLAMPAALGYAVHLVARPGTPGYERDAVAHLPRGAVSEELGPIVARVRELRG